MVAYAVWILSWISLVLLSPNTTAFIPMLFPKLQFWTGILTHMVSHGNLFHLIGNFMVFTPYMLYVEHKLGWKKTAIAYLVTGLWAVTSQTISTMGAGGLIGSSGAGFGMISIGALLYYQDVLSKPMAGWKQAIGYASFGIQLLCSVLLYQYLAALFIPGNVAFLAHLGGLIGGAIMVLYWTKQPMIPSKKQRRR